MHPQHCRFESWDQPLVQKCWRIKLVVICSAMVVIIKFEKIWYVRLHPIWCLLWISWTVKIIILLAISIHILQSVLMLVINLFYLNYFYLLFIFFLLNMICFCWLFSPLKLIRNGEIDAALSNLRDWYPQIMQVNTIYSAVAVFSLMFLFTWYIICRGLWHSKFHCDFSVVNISTDNL